MKHRILGIVIILLSFVLFSFVIKYNTENIVKSNHSIEKNETIKLNSPMDLIPCQHCGDKHPNKNYKWYVCNKCGFRIDAKCISKHGKGYKCSKCDFGKIKAVQY